MKGLKESEFEIMYFKISAGFEIIDYFLIAIECQ